MEPRTDKEAIFPPLENADQHEKTARQAKAVEEAKFPPLEIADHHEKAAQLARATHQAKAAQQQLEILQAQINAIAPDTAQVHIVVSRHNNTVEVGLFDTQPSGKPAWAVRRHPTPPDNLIAWTVPQDVTINSIEGKSDQLPIDVVSKGGAPGKPFIATVKSDAGGPGDYLINVTYKPAHGDAVQLVIDPEFIVNRP
jgi:type II secretory pathway pseudopilin PulG